MSPGTKRVFWLFCWFCSLISYIRAYHKPTLTPSSPYTVHWCWNMQQVTQKLFPPPIFWVFGDFRNKTSGRHGFLMGGVLDLARSKLFRNFTNIYLIDISRLSMGYRSVLWFMIDQHQVTQRSMHSLHKFQSVEASTHLKWCVLIYV